MASRHAAGPSPKGERARAIEQLPGRLDATATAQAVAEQAISEMVANGATFTPQRRDDGLASFVFEVAGNGDRERCREILREVKAKPDVWGVMVHLIGTTAAEAPRC